MRLDWLTDSGSKIWPKSSDNFHSFTQNQLRSSKTWVIELSFWVNSFELIALLLHTFVINDFKFWNSMWKFSFWINVPSQNPTMIGNNHRSNWIVFIFASDNYEKNILFKLTNSLAQILSLEPRWDSNHYNAMLALG